MTTVDIVPEKVELINNKKSTIQDEHIEKYLAEKKQDLTATLDAKEACVYRCSFCGHRCAEQCLPEI